jgi:hypothetical protein
MEVTEQSFGVRNFGHAVLGDKRRTDRLVELADRMVHRPGGSLPEKINSPKDLRAMYRLLDCEKVTHEAILKSHQHYLLNTLLESRDGFTLAIHDGSELEYTNLKSLTDDLGQIGSGFRRGFIAHNSLLVCPERGATLGLINQVLHRRAKVKKGETRSQRQKRESRESLLWIKGVQPLPADRKIVDVCDRGADTSEFIAHESRSGRTFVIRSSNNRNCIAGHEVVEEAETLKLHDYARGLPEIGTWELQLAGKTEFKSPGRTGKKEIVTRKKRVAKMSVSCAPVQLKLSRSKTAAPVLLWIVRVWEKNPPADQERLEWFLITNHCVTTFEDAYQVVGWYEKRWVIEEYHKCLKTGMSIEGFQFTDTDRLEPAIALTSIIAITLLNLRDDSRNEETKDRPATEYIDSEYVAILSAWRHGQPKMDWTVSQFVLALARLSGHQNRKGDKPPGWQKLWKGWRELHAMLTGARIAKKMKKCGIT